MSGQQDGDKPDKSGEADMAQVTVVTCPTACKLTISRHSKTLPEENRRHQSSRTI